MSVEPANEGAQQDADNKMELPEDEFEQRMERADQLMQQRNFNEAETELLQLDSVLASTQLEQRRDMSTMLVDVYSELYESAKDQDDLDQLLALCIERGAWNNKLVMIVTELGDVVDEEVVEAGEMIASEFTYDLSNSNLDLETKLQRYEKALRHCDSENYKYCYIINIELAKLIDEEKQLIEAADAEEHIDFQTSKDALLALQRYSDALSKALNAAETHGYDDRD